MFSYVFESLIFSFILFDYISRLRIFGVSEDVVKAIFLLPSYCLVRTWTVECRPNPYFETGGGMAGDLRTNPEPKALYSTVC